MFGVVFTFGVPMPFVYAQDQLKYESVRYFSVWYDRYITVRAAHIGWAEDYETISQGGTNRASLLKYMRMNAQGDTEWTDWEFLENVPIPGADSTTLRGVYTMLLEDWRIHPDVGKEMQGNDFNLLKISAVPNNRNSPVWLDNDGDLHLFWKLYLIN